MRQSVLIISAIVILVLTLAVSVVFFETPPVPILRSVGSSAAPAIMAGNPPSDTGLSNTLTRLEGAYVQTSLAAHIGRRVIPPKASDEEALFRIVLFVRDHVLSQLELMHEPRSWPVLVSGLGYCDQINAAVGVIAAQRFDVVQLYALYNPAGQISSHTIGRVWSSLRGEWLYYDAFRSIPVIYTRGANGAAQFIDVAPSEKIVARGEPEWPIYSERGWIMSQFESTFGRFLLVRAEGAWRERMRSGAGKTEVGTAAAEPRRLASEWSKPEIKGVAGEWVKPENVIGGNVIQSPAVPPPGHVDDEVFKRISRAFFTARMNDLLGSSSRAEYQRIGSDPSALRDDRAAFVAAISARLAKSQAH